MATETIKVNELAQRLGVPGYRIHELVKTQYVRPVPPHKGAWGERLVTRPPDAVIDWLKNGFLPIGTRPFIRLKEVTQLAECDQVDVLAICSSAGVTIFMDPLFGQLLSIEGLQKFIKALHNNRNPNRFDRGAFLQFLRGHSKSRPRVHPVPYSQKLEQEIQRVAQMAEPERTLRAAALISAYRDAKTVSDCWGGYNTRVQAQIKRAEKGIRSLTTAVLKG